VALPEHDMAFLANRGLSFSISEEGGLICVLIADWPLPPGYDHGVADLLLRLQTGYPDLPPDMWWFYPAVRLANGSLAPNSDQYEPHLPAMGRQWQRWSRHFQNGQWQSGIDGLESFLALIRGDMTRYAARAA
jgi:hypothetical protein